MKISEDICILFFCITTYRFYYAKFTVDRLFQLNLYLKLYSTHQNLFTDNMDFTKQVEQLKELAQHCIKDPSLLHDPKLSSIKNLIEHYGGKIPEAKANDSADAKSEFKSDPAETQPESQPESEESDLELDMTGVIGLYIYLF